MQNSEMKRPSKIEQMNRNIEQTKPVGARLQKREETIERHLQGMDSSAFEIGKELAAIRDEKDFGESTFEEYVRNRWGRERTWGYRMIEGYKVKAGLPADVAPGIQNEKQARALSKAPKEKREAVMREAAKDGPPTAKKIAQVIETDFRVVVKDANGDEVPEDIAAEFQKSRDEVKHIRSLLSEVRRWLEDEQTFKVELSRASAIESINDVRASVAVVAGDYLCPICKGKKCKVCHKRGFVSKLFYTQKISDDKK